MCIRDRDGYLARRLQQSSAFGAFLDPVADKLIVCIALVLVIYKNPSMFVLIPSLVIIGREITVSALREWMAELGQRRKVAVSNLGKLKTSVQMISITFLLWHESVLGLPIYLLGQYLLALAAVLTLLSMLDYLRAAFRP